MRQQGPMRSSNSDESTSFSGLFLKCYVVMTAVAATLGGAIGVSRLFSSNKYPTFDNFTCDDVTSNQFSDHAFNTFNYLYVDTTKCSKPNESFLRLNYEVPGLLSSFTSFVEQRKSFDKAKGRAVEKTLRCEQPGDGFPNVMIRSEFIKDADGNEVSQDPGFGDTTFIQGELRQGNNVCRAILRRPKCS
ncbi:MAG: hypothetical protein AB7I18_10320 [Candidatus Berkiella sp.]